MSKQAKKKEMQTQNKVKAKFTLYLKELKEEDKKPSDEHIETMNNLKSTSARMRYLDSVGFTTGNIARLLGKRYQHARNVLITPLKRKVKNG